MAQPTAGLSERARSGLRAYLIGFVFQAFHLVGYRTAVENVETGLLYQKVRRKERQRRAIEVLEQVGLADRMWATPTQMSGGERQRVALARASGPAAGARAVRRAHGQPRHHDGRAGPQADRRAARRGLDRRGHHPRPGGRRARPAHRRDPRRRRAQRGRDASGERPSGRWPLAPPVDPRPAERGLGGDHPATRSVAAHRTRNGRRRRRVRRDDRDGIDGQGPGGRALRRARGHRGEGDRRREPGRVRRQRRRARPTTRSLRTPSNVSNGSTASNTPACTGRSRTTTSMSGCSPPRPGARSRSR